MERTAKILGKKRTREMMETQTQTQTQTGSTWLMSTIAHLINRNEATMKQHRYKFENTRDAAKKNTKILKQSKYDFERAMRKEEGTMLAAGSEFRAPEAVEKLFKHHEKRPKMKQILTKGVTYHMEDLPEQMRQEDLRHMVDRGNHKSAEDPDNHPTLFLNYEKEVTMGWMIPVTLESVMKIKDAGVIPVGIAKQFTINNKGRRQIKRRTTHDASFPPPSNQSLNDRLIQEALDKCVYGHYLLRLLHVIQKMRYTHPKVRILISKLDLDAAYRRLHMLAKMAVLTITVI